MKVINYKLCNKRYRISFAMVLYLKKRKVKKWLNQTM
jgi:hypothetical protein